MDFRKESLNSIIQLMVKSVLKFGNSNKKPKQKILLVNKSSKQQFSNFRASR